MTMIMITFHYVVGDTLTISRFILVMTMMIMIIIALLILHFVVDDMTGSQSVFTIYEGHEIMFHVSTLLPYTPDNPQQVSYIVLPLNFTVNNHMTQNLLCWMSQVFIWTSKQRNTKHDWFEFSCFHANMLAVFAPCDH